MNVSKISKKVGALLILAALLGIILLSLDNVLRTGAPTHYYILMLFVILDLVIGAFVIAKPTKLAFSTAVSYSLLRIILQLADVSQASVYQFSSYGQFADYLFNPASGLSVSLGNPPGIPGSLIDLIMILEIVVIALAWRGRRELAKS
jgi:hypothetical protein